MSTIYDNWEKLVGAVLKEQLWQLFHSDSVSPSISSDSSGFSFPHLSTSLDHVSFCFPNPSNLVEDLSLVDHLPLSPIKEAPPRKQDLKIEVPKYQIQDLSCSSEYRPSSSRSPNSGVYPGGGGIQIKCCKEEAEQQSYPLPLPPGAISKSAPVSPTPLPLPPGAMSKSAPVSPAPSPPSCSPGPGTCWKKGKLIGRGPLGNVYLGFNSEKGQMCAMKEARLLADAYMKRGAQTLETEIALLRHMRHPNIVQYLGTEMVGDNFYLYLEYVSGGSIHTILQEYGKLGESAIRNYTLQILAGLAYLHSKNIVHGNIKAASILVDPNGRVKLSNFFIEKHISGNPNQSLLVDSPYWAAPEVITNSNVRNSACDIWSLGCTVLEMATSKPPLSQYKGVMAMFKLASKNELPVIPDHLSDVCKDFLRCCLQWNPLHRTTASQLLEHPFVRRSSPLGKQLLVSSSSVHPVVTNAMSSERYLHSKEYIAPVTPVGSPLLHPASPQPLKEQMSPPPPKPIIGSIQSPPNRVQKGSHTLPQQSKKNSPSYWDPNILQTVFRFS